MHSRAQASAEPLVELRLQRVIPRLTRIASEANHALGGIDARSTQRLPGVAVERLKQVVPEGAHIARRNDQVLRELTLNVETELIGDGRPEVFGNDRPRQQPQICSCWKASGIDCRTVNTLGRLLAVAAP